MKKHVRFIGIVVLLAAVVVAAFLLLGNAGGHRIKSGVVTLQNFPQYWEQVEKTFPADAQFFYYPFELDVNGQKDGTIDFLLFEFTVVQKGRDDAQVVQLGYSGAGSGIIHWSETARIKTYEVDKSIDMGEMLDFMITVTTNRSLLEQIKTPGFMFQYGWSFSYGEKLPFLSSAGRIFAVDGGKTEEIIDDNNYSLPKSALGAMFGELYVVKASGTSGQEVQEVPPVPEPELLQILYYRDQQ
jgi:hypothetical protein